MCVGEIRHLVVPSTVAYGGWSAGDRVPPKSTIEFFVEVLAIKDTFKENDMISDTFKDIDTNRDLMLSHDEGNETDRHYLSYIYIDFIICRRFKTKKYKIFS